MKTISVREVSEALGISPRGVLYRREKGHLKGILVKNDRGVDEYRIYPTKEIIEGLKRINSPLVASPEAIDGFDVVDAQTVSEEDKIFDSTYGPDDVVETSTTSRQNWTETSKAAATGMAEELWNNVISRFMEKLEEKDQLIGEMRIELKDKERQLLLLPDLEAQAKKARDEADKIADAERRRAEEESRRAETERKNAEIKALEVEALKKQVGLLQERIDTSAAPELEKQLELEKAAKTSEITLLQSQLNEAKAAKDAEIKALQGRLADIEEYKRLSEEAQRKLDDLQKTLEERNEVEEQKASETAAIKTELASLAAKLEKSQKPWWKKWLSIQE